MSVDRHGVAWVVYSDGELFKVAIDDAKCTPTTVFSDPMLGMLGSNGGASPTILPAASSPAIGAGVMCPPTDQRGMTRPSTMCTSGSVEGSQ